MPMRLGVIGGRLQGTEAAYLGGLAGYDVVLVDRCEGTPASGLASETHVLDIRANEARTRTLLASCDAVLPAFEDLDALRWLDGRLRRWGVPFVFDLAAYEVTCSKLRSDLLFAELDVPRPSPWPGCGLPVVVKPSGASGSDGVAVAGTYTELTAARARLEEQGHEVVVQEHVLGPSLSLEVVAAGGRVQVLQTTSLEFDLGHDCKRVVAPGECDGRTAALLEEAGERIAATLGLRGLMDVEAMVADGVPKIIEVDARLPSQTPSAVYHSCDLNLLSLLVDTVLLGSPPAVDRRARRAAVYQHVAVSDGVLEVVGEHALAHARPLTRTPGFFGAHDALTDFRPGASHWTATIITTGSDACSARAGGDEVIARMVDDLGLALAPDLSPRWTEVAS